MTGLVSIGTERKARMANTGKGFRILSATLYTDKPLAMVREIVHNAIDAHRAVGKADVPFLLHVPTEVEPWFAVRDFGPSIPDVKIDEVYLTYLQSTKQRHSGDVAGQLGLGSKAPLAVAESFNVATFIDGVKRIYTVFFDENDEVTVSPAIAEPTDEPDGLEVRVEIPVADCAQVQKKIAQVLTFIDPLPVFSGKTIVITRPDTAIEGERFSLRANIGYSYSSSEPRGPRAIMGGIIYPIDLALVPDLTEDEKEILELPLDIEFPLGTLDFTPSRESLSYDKKRTLPALKAEAHRLRKALTVSIEAIFAQCKTELAARRKFAEVTRRATYGNSAPLQPVMAALRNSVVWRDQIIDRASFKRSLGAYPDLKVTLFQATRRMNSVKSTVFAGRSPISLPPAVFEVVYNDRKTGSSALAKQHARYKGGSEGDVVLLYLEGPEASRVAFLNTLPHLTEINPASHYAADKPERTKSNARRVGRGRHGCSLDRKALASSWAIEINPRSSERTGFYVSLTRHAVDDHRFTQDAWERAYDVAFETGLFTDDDDVYAIASSDATRFEKSPHWVEFYGEARRRAEQFVAKANPWLARARYAAVEALELDSDWDSYLTKLVPTLAPAHPIRQFFETYAAWIQDYRDKRSAIKLVEAFHLRPQAVAADQDLGAALTLLRARYPLLTALVSHERGLYRGYSRHDANPTESVESLAHPYIALVDGVAIEAVQAPAVKTSTRKRAA